MNISKNKSENSQRNIPRGIIIGYNSIPIDNSVLSSLSDYGLSQAEIDKTLSSLEANRHNSLTTTYYLAFKKYIKEGHDS